MGQQEGIGAAESVLITVSARSGLTVGAQKAYKLALKNGKSRMIYIGKVDAEHADFYKVFEDLKSAFGPSICPVVVPIEQAGGRVFLLSLIHISSPFKKSFDCALFRCCQQDRHSGRAAMPIAHSIFPLRFRPCRRGLHGRSETFGFYAR